MKTIQFILIGFSWFLLSGCLPPNGNEHQKGVDCATAIETSAVIEQGLKKQNSKIQKVTVAVTTSVFTCPKVHLAVYLEKSLKDYELLFNEAQKEMKKINEKWGASLTIYEGDENINKLLIQKDLQ